MLFCTGVKLGQSHCVRNRLTAFENRMFRKMLGLRTTRKQGSGENYMMRNFMVLLPTEYYPGDQIEKNAMGGECGMYG